MIISYGNQQHPRPIIRRFDIKDLGRVAELDETWKIEDFAPYLNFDDHTAQVQIGESGPIAIVCYRFSNEAFYLHRVVVHPGMRRWGLGRGLVQWLKERVSPARQNRIVTAIDEQDVHSQLFMKACGFQCVSTREHWLYFCWGVTRNDNPWHPTNRISKHLEAR